MRFEKINTEHDNKPKTQFTQDSAETYIQPKLTINKPDDPYEKEADMMADQVMRMEASPRQQQGNGNLFFKPKPVNRKLLQPKCAHCEEEEKMQRKEKNGQEAIADNDLENYVDNINGGQSLPAELRNGYELKFGYDFSNVKLHTDTQAVKSAQSINALAFTAGNNIVFNNGQYDPASSTGKKLLAHELTHVVQQGGAGMPAIQKTTGDGHDLQSENFRGDEVLEGCFDGEVPHYLKKGKRGEAVRKLQEVLLQLGFQLPKFGVDGIFMNETDSAVRDFQRENALSADGIVGPITIGTMDSQLPAKSSPPEPNPTPPIPPVPQPVCPPKPGPGEPPVLQTKIKITRKQAVGQLAAKSIQRKHLTMIESMDEFSKKVNSSVASDPQATSMGQFYWSRMAKDLIMKDITASYTFLNPIPGKVDQLFDAIVSNDAKKIAKLMTEIPQEIEKSGVANAPNLVKMFLPTVAEDPTILWTKFNKLNRVPADFESKHKNFSAYAQLRSAERSACWSVAEFMRGRFQTQGGFTDLDTSKKGKTKPAIASSPHSGATRNFEWVGSRTKGDVVSYNASILSSLIAKMKSAIDDGFTLHARVVSGVNFGTGLHPSIKAAQGVTPPPSPKSVPVSDEHSIVIIGYDDVSHEFIFWDPDSSVSSFRGRQGFGILHFNSNRFTTASNDNDLFVNEDGSHSSTGNKRYQVIAISS